MIHARPKGFAIYVVIVKDNPPTLRADIELLFAEPAAAAFFEDRHVMIDQGHGRLKVRTLQSSSALNDYLD